MSDTNNLGPAGEHAAASFLKGLGYEIIEMNYKNDTGRRLGEIDIIAKDRQDDELVFVEVKTREYQKYQNTLPEENITYSKLRKLSRIAADYLHRNGLQAANYRFDAVSVWFDSTSRAAKIKHIRNMYL